MPKRNYTPEQIINSLREAEVLISKGNTAAEAARHLGISEQTYYKWRKEYGGMRIMFFTIEKCTKFQPKTVPLNTKKINKF